nr:hypothetical protein CFP56_46759 [Quercus suber]
MREQVLEVVLLVVVVDGSTGLTNTLDEEIEDELELYKVGVLGVGTAELYLTGVVVVEVDALEYFVGAFEVETKATLAELLKHFTFKRKTRPFYILRPMAPDATLESLADLFLATMVSIDARRRLCAWRAGSIVKKSPLSMHSTFSGANGHLPSALDPQVVVVELQW